VTSRSTTGDTAEVGVPVADVSSPSTESRGNALLRGFLRWVGIIPYFVFIAIFLLIPVLANFWSSIHENGKLSGGSLARLWEPQYRDAFVTSINLSLLTALVGGACGLLLAWALATTTRPRWLKSIVQSFSAVASQSGGVALAFSFIAAIGAQGLVTQLIAQATGWNLSGTIKLTSFFGLAIVYLYFQIPLMAILLVPALEGTKTEWAEAAMSLGASRWQYLRQIALPILLPSIAGSLLLLFANSFSAYATAYALTGGGVNLVPILVGFFISGNVVTDNSFAAAMVTGMMVIIIVSMVVRALLLRRSTRWLR